MQLLVSVADAAEAEAALVGGADIIDAKDPTRGTLGAVGPKALGDIVGAVHDTRPVSAALGDLGESGTCAIAEHTAYAASIAGLAFVKVGFAGVERAADGLRLATAAVRGAARADRPVAVVCVAYADVAPRVGLGRQTVLDIAAACGASGVLLDTADKHGGTLFELVPPEAVEGWVCAAHAAGLTVALAGSLRAQDLPIASALGADVVAVRTAACDGGRTGRVTTQCVRALADVAHTARWDNSHLCA